LAGEEYGTCCADTPAFGACLTEADDQGYFVFEIEHFE
jgi:hypothetical protein